MSATNWANKRQPANEKSRNTATNHGERWCAYEVDFLVEFYGGREDDLLETAEALGRTTEACRYKYWEAVNGTATRAAVVPLHVSGWLVDFCTGCGRHTDVYCNGSNIKKCEDCK